jgi:hypothetical protein
MSALQVTILVAYFLLLFLCGAMLVGAEFVGPTVRENMAPLASEGFKTVLGALVGSLSMLLGGKK